MAKKPSKEVKPKSKAHFHLLSEALHRAIAGGTAEYLPVELYSPRGQHIEIARIPKTQRVLGKALQLRIGGVGHGTSVAPATFGIRFFFLGL